MKLLSDSYMEYTTKDGYMATLTEEDLHELIEYCIHKDAEAIMALMDQERAIMLKPGMRVFVLDSQDGIIKCRRKGQSLIFYTVQEAVQ